ncbi:MAG: GntR family transcriptional regulator [Cereibacter sphaeroides]|uniref:GntR family transcriptional regulator n=1 Tax=Cereibacter sphaeroides TaxID=1063 RepID=A0A2W5SEP0_CERSP|nr:MAG: GntR family transcriptional regulator [Cereibacter sphaeroides]
MSKALGRGRLLHRTEVAKLPCNRFLKGIAFDHPPIQSRNAIVRYSRQGPVLKSVRGSKDQPGEIRVVKLEDVARRAGCSVATASRVLNGNPKVGQVERERVLAAATQLGYVPNNSARALRAQSTRLIGVIIPTLDHAIYAKMVDGLQDRLAEVGISVIINTSGYDLDREQHQARLLVGRGVEAIVMVGSEHHPELADHLQRSGIAQVFTYTNELGSGDAAVGFDNYASGASVARFLLDLGHRSFGMIAGVTRGNDRARQRRDGFVETLLTANVARGDIVVIEAPYTIDHGRAGMQSLMQTFPRPTAVFCGSDILAVGAVKYCQVAGISIPEEVSIVGFDNLEVAQLTTPELTTVDVPAREMGEAAAQTLRDAPGSRPDRVIAPLQTRLIVRQSTGPARA